MQQKTCENCHQTFECNMEDIAACHCNQVALSNAAKALIASKFNDCLCNACLVLLNEQKELV